jgi:hypothetical protein
MRTLSTATAAARQLATIVPFYLVEIGTLRYTSYNRDLVFNGNTYFADGVLYSVEPPKAVNTINRQPFSVVLADPAFDYAATLDSGLYGKSVSIYVTHEDASGQPLLSTTDVILTDRGRVDGVSYEVPENEVLIKITCTNPMRDLDQVKAYYTTQSFADSNTPGDKAYESIYEGSRQISLQWGRGL